MKPLSIKLPAYRRHQPQGRLPRAAVTIDGQHIYLGEYDSPESWEKYHQEIAKWLAAKAGGAEAPKLDAAAPFLGVNNLVEAYLEFAEERYVNDAGEQTAELDCIVSALGPLTTAFGLTNAREFGPKNLKAVRQLMIAERGWTRGTINKAVSRIKRMFRWATSEELLSPGVLQALESVEGLRSRTSRVKETEPVKPVAEEDVRAIFPFVAPQVADRRLFTAEDLALMERLLVQIERRETSDMAQPA